MTDLDIIIRAAQRARQRLVDFADGNGPSRPLPESYHAVVQDIGAFGVFIEELLKIQTQEIPQ